MTQRSVRATEDTLFGPLLVTNDVGSSGVTSPNAATGVANKSVTPTNEALEESFSDVDVTAYLLRGGGEGASSSRSASGASLPALKYPADDGNRTSDGTIAALLDELEAIQVTYGRLTAAFSNSERDNGSLLNTLQSIKEERDALLLRVSAKKASLSRDSAEDEMLRLRMRVQELEAENADLRNAAKGEGAPLMASPMASEQLPLTDALLRSPMPVAPNTAVRGTANAASQSEGAELFPQETSLSDKGPSTAGVSLMVSPDHSPNTKLMLGGDVRHSRLNQRLRQVDESCGNEIPSAAAPVECTQLQYEGCQQCQRWEMYFAANEEKLLMMLQTRQKQIHRVSRMLASAESRNVELGTLLEQICVNVNRQRELDSGMQNASSLVANDLQQEGKGQQHAQPRSRKTSLSSTVPVNVPFQHPKPKVPPPPQQLSRLNSNTTVESPADPGHLQSPVGYQMAAQLSVQLQQQTQQHGQRNVSPQRFVRTATTNVGSYFNTSNIGRVMIEKPRFRL